METYINQFINRLIYNNIYKQRIEHITKIYSNIVKILAHVLEVIVMISFLFVIYDIMSKGIETMFTFNNAIKYIIFAGVFIILYIPAFIFNKKLSKSVSTHVILNTGSIENVNYAERLIKDNLVDISNIIIKSIYNHNYAFIDISDKIYSIDLDKCQLDIVPSEDDQWHFARKNNQLSVVTYPTFE